MQLLNENKTMNGKPLRYRAEIMIWRDGKVLITNGKHGTYVWHGLPGGGIDEGETPEQAAAREALEEVGVAVKNVQQTGEVYIGPNPPGLYGARARMYGGVHTTLLKADFDKFDQRLLGVEGDAATFTWMTPKDAVAAISKDHDETRNNKSHRIRELQKYI